MKAARILVVDDDAAVRKTICRILEGEGLHTEQAADGEAALALLGIMQFDLAIVDIMLGGMSGFDVIKAIREIDAAVLVIVLSAKMQDTDKIFALAIGADDYLTKPFSPYFLCAKVKAALRRSQAGLEGEVVQPPFRYLPGEMRLFKGEQELRLTAIENKMMLHFLKNPGRVCSKDELYQYVWGNEIVDNNTIMVCISNLRKKIEENPEQPAYIETVRGLGYRFTARADTRAMRVPV